MKPRFTPIIVRLRAVSLFVLAAAIALRPTPGWGQSYCGPATVVNFNVTNGAYPVAGVTFDSQGAMYGTTTGGGGASGLGTIWKYTPSAGLTTLFTFSGSSSPSNNGYEPKSRLAIDGQGNLYGSTYYGGNNFNLANMQYGWGTLFKLSSSGQFTELYQFSGLDGANPLGTELIDSQGSLWGTTFQGGSAFNNLGNDGYGTIFKYSGGTLTNPVSFNIGDGENISGGMATDGQGNYYGTTYQGGSNSFGTLFQYSSTSGQLTTLFNFNRFPNGSFPTANVTYDGKGNLFGTTEEGGAHSSASNYCCGTVWKYSLSTGVLTTLVSFDGDTVPADGISPTSGVTLDANGNIFGTTNQGGTSSDGIVYEFSSTGVLSTLVTFSGPNGQGAEDLAFDSSGNLWGVTNGGGSSGYGTLYELTPNTGSGCGPSLSSLTFSPASIPNGGSTTGTVTLNEAAPSGGSVVSLVSGYPYIEMPATVTVPAGSISATFTGTAQDFINSDATVSITANLGNSTVQGSLTQTPGVAVKSISLNPSTVTGGNSSTGTVTIASPAPSGGNEVLISLSQNPPCTLPVTLPNPNPVTVPAGQTSVSFTVGSTSTTTSCTAPIFGQSGGATVSTNFTVKPGSSSPTVSSVTLNPTSVTGGNNSTGTVTLSSAAPSGGSTVSLSSSNTSVASVPSSVTVSSGQTSANFTVTTTSVTTTMTAVITATLGSSSAQATLTITPAGAVSLSSLTLNPTSVSGGNNSTGTVTLSAAAPSGGATVTLKSNNTSVATIPSSVTVSSGQTSATFTVSTQRVSSNTNVVISGTYAGGTQSATLTVTGRHH